MPIGFIDRKWRIRSNGAFAGSCIGVILLVMVLELLRRASREYDALILRAHARAHAEILSTVSSEEQGSNKVGATTTTTGTAPHKFKPSPLQQAVRALLHMLQFAVAYFVMLLAMYYNGYIIICIFIGAFLGAFVFSWQSIEIGYVLQTITYRASLIGLKRNEQREVTFCCG